MFGVCFHVLPFYPTKVNLYTPVSDLILHPREIHIRVVTGWDTEDTRNKLNLMEASEWGLKLEKKLAC